MKVFFKIPISKKFLVLAILLRILIMPFFFHPDIKTYHFQASFLQQGVLNIYNFLPENREKLPLKEEFVYFPAAYFFLGSYQVLAKPFLGHDFQLWLSNAIPLGQSIFRYLFILKLPYLILDLLIAFVLYNYFENEKRKKTAFYLWLFNPFSLVLIYFYSNIDIIPVFFSILSLYLVKKNKGLLAGVMLALGSGFKAYPILLLPALLLTKEKLFRQIVNLFASSLVFVVIILPFWSPNFLMSSFSSGLTNRVFENGIDVGLIRKIPYFLIFYTVGFIYIYFKKRQKQWLFYLLTTLLLVTTIDYHIQWLLWFTPFLIILLVNNTKYLVHVLIIMLIGITTPLLLNDKYLTVGLLSPVSRIFFQVSYPYLFVRQFIDPILIQKILRSVFFIYSVLITYKVIVNEKQ